MSLDIYFIGQKETVTCECCGGSKVVEPTVHEQNITHNLTTMADVAGLYKPLWRPEEVGLTKAGELIPALEVGIADMKANPDKYTQHNADNGWGTWGTYDQFVPWLEKLLEAAKEYPEAKINVSR